MHSDGYQCIIVATAEVSHNPTVWRCVVVRAKNSHLSELTTTYPFGVFVVQALKHTVSQP